MEPIIPRNTSELAQSVVHLGAETGAKATLGTALGTTAGAATNAAPAAAAGGSIAGGVWLTAIMSAVLAQLEFRQRKNELKDMYRQELAAQLGKPVEQITADDFDQLAKTNHTFGEELAKSKKQRTINIGVIAVATFASVGIAFGVIGLLGGAAAAGPVMGWLATTAVAMMAYGIVKYPVQKLAETLVGVEKKTTQERIEEIYKDHQAGKVISRERVFDVFVHANPPLDRFIEEKYGKSFDKLKPVDKLHLADTIGLQLNVEQLTESINQGKIKSTELAFTVDGKFSGVAPTQGDVPKHTLREKVSETMHNVADKVHHAADKLTHPYHPADDKPAGFSHAKREMDRRAATTEIQR